MPEEERPPGPSADPASGSVPATAGEDRRTGTQRLVAALRHPGRGQVVVGVLLALVGFAAVTQVRANRSDDTYAGLRQADLIEVLTGLDAGTSRAEQEIADLEAARDELRTSAGAQRAALRQARAEARALAVLAGTVPVTGRGIVITVEDPVGEVGVNQILNGVEELRDAGAEAIELNDRARVVAQTSFEDAPGGGILVDDEPLSPPYTIDVIGDPVTLSGALNIFGGFRDEIGFANGTVEVARTDDVQIASTVPDEPTRYAEPVPPQ